MRFGDTIVHENDDGEDNEGTVEDQEVLENSMNESEPVDYISTFPVKSWKSTKAIINSSMHSTKNLFGVISSAEKSNAALSITIPFGFQMMRSLPHSRATIASVINIPSASTVDTFVSLDSHNIHIWKGANHVKNIPTAALPGRHDAVALRADSAKLGVAGISKWLYVEKYRIYIVTSVQMHIRILDSYFGELFSITYARPILSISYIQTTNELITGEVGGIKVWKLNYESQQAREIFSLSERLTITEITSEEWVYFVSFNRSTNQIIAAVESNLYLYDLVTGRRTDALYRLHEMSITCVAYYEPYKYLITGAKDGRVKVWNCQNLLVCDFSDHMEPITGLELVETGCEATPRTIPVVLSCSLDGSIRMFNFETSQCVYRFDVQHEILGIGFIKKDIFYHYSKQCVYIWTMNRFHYTFSFLRSQPIMLRRETQKTIPPRILSLTSDGSIKLLSPVSGSCIITAFPIHKDDAVTDAAYDMTAEKIYALNESGDIATYDVQSNPAKVLSIWEYSNDRIQRDKINCVVAVTFNSRKGSMHHSKSFTLIGGTSNGQLININLSQEGKQEPIVQAHTGEVVILKYDIQSKLVVSLGKDIVVKVWNVSPVQRKEVKRFGSLDAETTGASCGFTLEIDLIINLGNICLQLPKIIVLDTNHKVLAIPQFGNLTLHSYEHGQSTSGGSVKNSNQAVNIQEITNTFITQIAHLAAFDVWATSSTDGTVKIWDADNIIIREIQFNEPIMSLCFCNDQGDILVGLSDQIAIVRIQDYFPLNLLKLAATKSFPDDPVESPLMFDSQLDFWEFYYWEELEKYGQVDWHLSKPQNRQFDILQTGIGLNNIRTQKMANEMMIKRRNKRLFLESEHKSFISALKRHEVTPSNVLHYDDAVPNDMDQQQTNTHEDDVDGKPKPNIPTFTETHVSDYSSCSDSEKELADAAYMRFKPEISQKRIARPSPLKPVYSKFLNSNSSLIPLGQMMPTSPLHSMVKLSKTKDEEEDDDEDDAESCASLDMEVNDVRNAESLFVTKQKKLKSKDKASKKKKVVRIVSKEVMRPDPKEFHRKQEILRLAVKPNIHKATVSSSRKKNDTKQNLRRHAVALPNSMVGGQIMQEREAQERIKVERRRREKEFSQAVNNDQVYLEAVGESSKEGTDENNRAVINNLMSVTMREAMQRMHKRKEAEVYEKQQLLIASQSPLENENGIFKGAIKDLFLDSQDDLAVHDEEEDKAEPPSVLPMREYDITRRESQYDPSIKNQEYNTLVNNLKKSLVVKAEPVSHKPAAKKSGNRRKSHANTAFRCEDESEDHSSAVLRATTRNDIPAIPKPIKVVVAAPPPPPKKASPPKLAPAITDKRRMSVVKEMRPAFKATPVKTTVFTPTIPVKLRNNLQDRVPFGKSNHSSTESIESMEETFVEDEDTFGVGLNKNEVDYEIASHYIWNLIRYREASKKNNALNTIVEQFWFPGLKGQPITLANVVLILIRVLREGGWGEKLECIKALLYLYHVFPNDFIEPLRSIIRPQLDLLHHDDSWKVRLQVCSSILRYGIYDPEIILALICRLTDSNDQVRQLALESLVHFGISSRDSLRTAMITVGLLPANAGRRPKSRSFLDKLLEQLKNRLTQEANNTIVKVRKWMSKYSYTAPDGLVRSDSYMEHLAGPFFPPDNFTRRFRKRSSIFSSQPRNSETQWLENLEEVKRGWDFHEGTSYQSTVMLENIESWNSYRMSSTGGSSSGRRKSSAVYSDQGGGQEGGESARFPKQGSVNNRIMSTHRVVIREEFGNSGGVGSRRASTSANIGQRRQSVISETDDSYRRVSSSAGGGRRMSSIGSSTGDFGGGGSGLRKSLLGRKSSLLEEGGEELEDYYSTAPPSAAIVTTTRTNQRRMSIDSSDGSVRRAPVSFQNRGGATTAASTSAATAAGGLTTILDHEGSSHVSLHNSLFDISEKLIKAGSSKVRKVKVQSNSLLSKTIARVRPFTAGALHAAAPKNRPISAFADEMIRGVGTRGAGGSGRVGGAASTRAKSARVPATNGSSSTPVSIRPFTTLT